jgi:hypothetical protein
MDDNYRTSLETKTRFDDLLGAMTSFRRAVTSKLAASLAGFPRENVGLDLTSCCLLLPPPSSNSTV